MTYGDGIWLIGFLLTFLMERPIIVKEKHSTRDMDEKKSGPEDRPTRCYV